MDSFFQENRESYIQQVATFGPSQEQEKCDGGESGGDTLIATRVRPLLANEIEDNEVTGISVRPESGYADVHELRRKINGQPTLNVSVVLSSLNLNVLIFLRSLQASGSTRFMDPTSPQRRSTATLLPRWYHGRGEVESVLYSPMARLVLERRTA
jgi:hypothetical protein